MRIYHHIASIRFLHEREFTRLGLEIAKTGEIMPVFALPGYNSPFSPEYVLSFFSHSFSCLFRFQSFVIINPKTTKRPMIAQTIPIQKIKTIKGIR